MADDAHRRAQEFLREFAALEAAYEPPDLDAYRQEVLYRLERRAARRRGDYPALKALIRRRPEQQANPPEEPPRAP